MLVGFNRLTWSGPSQGEEGEEEEERWDTQRWGRPLGEEGEGRWDEKGWEHSAVGGRRGRREGGRLQPKGGEVMV